MRVSILVSNAWILVSNAQTVASMRGVAQYGHRCQIGVYHRSCVVQKQVVCA